MKDVKIMQDILNKPVQMFGKRAVFKTVKAVLTGVFPFSLLFSKPILVFLSF